MKNIFKKLLCFGISITILSGCARDLSSTTYTDDATLNLVLEGKILALRPIIIKSKDKLSENFTGILAGGAAGGALGNAAGKGSGNSAMIIGGMLTGALIGSIFESKLSQANGIEYIVKVDTTRLKSDFYHGSKIMRDAISVASTSGLITVIQGKDNLLSEGQDIYVIFSPKYTRVIKKN
ncbi:MAG: hypothetical protein ACK4OM_06060 [Alphaproteobacteria bacterium]